MNGRLTTSYDSFSIYPEIIEEPHFECVRRGRTHSKCDLPINFQIGTYAGLYTTLTSL